MELTDRKHSGKGVHGIYFNLEDGTGVKIIGATYGHAGSRTESELTESRIWKETEAEAQTMRRLQHLGFTPKFVKLEPVKYGEFFYPGLYMTHIQAKQLRDMPLSAAEEDKMTAQLRVRLAREGIRHRDMNCGNVMVGPNQEVYLVDLDPQYMSFSTMMKLYYRSQLAKMAIKAYNRVLKFFKKEELDYELSKFY